MKTVLGIDVGSVSIALVQVSATGDILKTDYRFHKGAINQTLKEMIAQIPLSEIGAIATTSSTPDNILSNEKYDSQVALITAVKYFHEEARGILFVGGENYGLIYFDKDGNYAGYKSSESCAAGTGSFLDQQAKRLKFESISSLGTAAFENKGDIPEIATRCAVFAKTDLIHAQQEGFSLAEISDGLCKGLSKNIVDTLFADGELPLPLVFAGGVSLNKSVVKHLDEMLKTKTISDKYAHLYWAIGAAFMYVGDDKSLDNNFASIDEFVSEKKQEKHYAYPPLKLELSDYPDFSALESYNFDSKIREGFVETDIYEKLKSQDVYLGIDVGSTSTKAAIISKKGKMLVGLYTRTSGQPISAVQLIFEAIDDIEKKKNIKLKIKGAGTTGSGRKFIGKLIGADLMVDEITAHARAAYEIDPEVDTIIEIGGQDAKFTTLKNGMVTFSVMNNVCAAGTGSFIEEQAQKLGCPLREYASRAINVKAPVASDRCTVFMERDLNHLLNEGFSVDEILASVLHSVRENYLSKVAVEANIGEKIFFQGATAKNKALVAAFEYKLKKPILVSKYCHLTGAMGSALMLIENEFEQTNFRGISIFKTEIPVETEICTLCNNNCKIKKITIQGETLGFGFLCGRDYNTKKFVNNKKGGFDLLKERNFAFERTIKKHKHKEGITIGIPSGLYLAEDRIFWEHFFDTLGIKTITSHKLENPITIGGSVSKADFCAPMKAFHGHVKYLADKADYIFLPVYLEAKEKPKNKKILRQLCYYAQYASSLASKISDLPKDTKFLMPLIDSREVHTKLDLIKVLKPVINKGYWAIYSAYEQALEFVRESQEKLKKIFEREFSKTKDISVVLLGRPYTVLEENMNKNIPEIFKNHEITAFYQDMIPYKENDTYEIEDILKAVHWNYASKILETALKVAKTDGLYPVYITSFKCSPDSFAIPYFKEIMDKFQKPYLILELDEHDSNVGYETRIEASINSFRNHFKDKVKDKINFISKYELKTTTEIGNRTLLIPIWDTYASPLIEAVFIKAGIDARLVELSDESIRKASTNNTGQCLPANITMQAYADYIKKHKLIPEETVVWMFDSVLACNIRMYPYFIKSMFEKFGQGLEKVDVYVGEISLTDISTSAALDAYFAYMFGGMLRKLVCKIRPYEKIKGSTDAVLNEAQKIFYNAFLGHKSKENAVERVVGMFKKIETVKMNKPKVAIFGDIYVRDNDFINKNVIKDIEAAGGEVITTPFSEFAKMISSHVFKRWFRMGMYKDFIQSKTIMAYLSISEKKYMKLFNEVLNEEPHKYEIDEDAILEQLNIKREHSGESFDNIIKTAMLKKLYPDLSLFVSLVPVFCCAGIVTEAMSSQIEEITNVPVVSLTYDGTSKPVNDKIIPYLTYLKKNIKN